MARKMKLDNDALAGIAESKAEIKRRKRQEKKLKKFGIRDESKMGKVELFFYQMEKKRRIKKKKRMSRSLGGDIALFIMLCLFGAFSAYPLVYTIFAAFKPLSELFIYPPKLFVMNPTFDNFIDLGLVMSDSWVPFSRYFFNTIFITLAGTVGHVLIASMAAYPLAKHRFPGSKIIFGMVVYSLMFAAQVTDTPRYIIFSGIGLVDTQWAIIVPAFAYSLGLYLMKQFIDSSVSDEMIEAARIDGAGELRIYWQIVMPLVKPAWLTLLVTTFQQVWNTGASVYVWSEQLKTFNSAINTISTVSIGASSAGTVVMMSVPIIVFIINQSKIVETMGSSGMKD